MQPDFAIAGVSVARDYFAGATPLYSRESLGWSSSSSGPHARTCVVQPRSVTWRAQVTNRQARLHHVFTNQLHAIRRGLRPRADHLHQILAVEVECSTVVCRISCLHAAGD